MLTTRYGRGSDFGYVKPPGLGLGAGASMDFSGDSAPIITSDINFGYLPTPPPETIVGLSYPSTPTALQVGLALPSSVPGQPINTKKMVNDFTDWINTNKTYVYALMAVLGVVTFLKRR